MDPLGRGRYQGQWVPKADLRQFASRFTTASGSPYCAVVKRGEQSRRRAGAAGDPRAGPHPGPRRGRGPAAGSMNAAYHRAWRAAHPEYRRTRGRALPPAASPAWPGRPLRRVRPPARASGHRPSAASGRERLAETSHPLLEAARTVALGQVRPDRRSVLFRPTFEDAVSEALVAIVAGEDPVPAVRRYLAAERAWLSRTAPLLDTCSCVPPHEPPHRCRPLGPGDAPGGARPDARGRPVGRRHARGLRARLVWRAGRARRRLQRRGPGLDRAQPGHARTAGWSDERHPCPGCLRVTSRPGRCVACGGGTTTQRGYGADVAEASGAAAAGSSGVRVAAVRTSRHRRRPHRAQGPRRRRRGRQPAVAVRHASPSEDRQPRSAVGPEGRRPCPLGATRRTAGTGPVGCGGPCEPRASRRSLRRARGRRSCHRPSRWSSGEGR